MFISIMNANQPLFSVRLAVYLVTLLIAVALPGHASAIGLDLEKLPPIPKYDLLPREKFEAETRLVEQEGPDPDKLLTYRIRLPKEWSENTEKTLVGTQSIDLMLNSSVLGSLARYTSPPVNLKRSYLQVEVQELDYAVGVRNWFINFVLDNGYSLMAVSPPDQKPVEAIYVQVIDGQTYAVRLRVFENGDKLILVRYFLPQENFDAEKAQQAQVMQSFEVVNKTDKPAERLYEYAFLDQSYMNYPESWILKPRSILSVERMSALLLRETIKDKDEPPVVTAQIKINIVSRLLKTSLTKEVNDFRRSVKMNGYALGDKIEDYKFKYDPSIEFGMAEAYKMIPGDPVNMAPYEFFVSVMQGKDFYYIVSLITPARGQDFENWARNMEAFKIVSESIRRGNIPKVDSSDPYYDYLNE